MKTGKVGASPAAAAPPGPATAGPGPPAGSGPTQPPSGGTRVPCPEEPAARFARETARDARRDRALLWWQIAVIALIAALMTARQIWLV